jgi:SAM-dependent methyltransferase
MIDSQPDLFKELTGFVLRRYQRNNRKSMRDVYEVDRDFLRLEKENLEFLFNNRTDVVTLLNNPDHLSDLARVFVKSSLEFTYNSNQYIHLDNVEQQRLLDMYQSYLRGMKQILETDRIFNDFEKDFSTLVKDHFNDLSSNISRFFDRKDARQVQENIILKQVVCAEYSPDFQLGLLGLSPEELLPPVLDLGCGKNGTLVKFLREKGIAALGVDRLVESDPALIEADWFDIKFNAGTWGTILSHMAFSNHFLFQHRYKYGKPHQYARLYMQILESLKPGGSFIYSPGLPFIEQFLPKEQFKVESKVMAKSNPMKLDRQEQPVVMQITQLAGDSTGAVRQ